MRTVVKVAFYMNLISCASGPPPKQPKAHTCSNDLDDICPGFSPKLRNACNGCPPEFSRLHVIGCFTKEISDNFGIVKDCLYSFAIEGKLMGQEASLKSYACREKEHDLDPKLAKFIEQYHELYKDVASDTSAWFKRCEDASYRLCKDEKDWQGYHRISSGEYKIDHVVYGKDECGVKSKAPPDKLSTESRQVSKSDDDGKLSILGDFSKINMRSYGYGSGQLKCNHAELEFSSPVDPKQKDQDQCDADMIRSATVDAIADDNLAVHVVQTNGNHRGREGCKNIKPCLSEWNFELKKK
jgi:hypothetical protein